MDRSGFRKALGRYFDSDELANIAFDLGMSTSAFSSRSSTVRARELLEYCEKASPAKIAKLIELCSTERAEVDWRSFLVDPASQGVVPESIQAPNLNSGFTETSVNWRRPLMSVHALQLIGNWEVATASGIFATLNLKSDGTARAQGHTFMLTGRWTVIDNGRVILLEGIVNDASPWQLTWGITNFSPDEFFAIDQYDQIHRFQKANGT